MYGLVCFMAPAEVNFASLIWALKRLFIPPKGAALKCCVDGCNHVAPNAVTLLWHMNNSCQEPIPDFSTMWLAHCPPGFLITEKMAKILVCSANCPSIKERGPVLAIDPTALPMRPGPNKNHTAPHEKQQWKYKNDLNTNSMTIWAYMGYVARWRQDNARPGYAPSQPESLMFSFLKRQEELPDWWQGAIDSGRDYADACQKKKKRRRGGWYLVFSIWYLIWYLSFSPSMNIV